MLFWTKKISSKYVHVNKLERTVRRSVHGKIFIPPWNLSVTPKHVNSRIKATGVYLFNLNRIPDEAYAPSDLIQQPRIEVQSDQALGTTSVQTPKGKASKKCTKNSTVLHNEDYSIHSDSECIFEDNNQSSCLNHVQYYTHTTSPEVPV
ncbi:hypothetical protein PR048_009266 [Dryococelus australis]|uniref:Uncharacterized protein n=1 Tax=Dryococelus australis TaxID=614101 RepID=A0ABQ9I192_9NEOP|nr:hypothetical protein PR048_009266 [Dryococelus australis]